jgi:type II secretory pathway predicted ATPase ExeA
MSLIEEHFNLHQPPFPQATNTAALLHHQSLKDALERLRFAVGRDGIALLSAESGCGKSTVLNCLCGELDPTAYLVVYSSLSSLGPFSLLSSLSTKIGLRSRRFKGETAIELLNHLRGLPKRTIIILDEAHILPDKSLEDPPIADRRLPRQAEPLCPDPCRATPAA